VVGDEQERALGVGGLDVFEAVDVHQVVGRHLNPARADVPLAPRPEILPAPLVHLVRLEEREPLDARKDADLLRRRV
jgi:hypothetical protein